MMNSRNFSKLILPMLFLFLIVGVVSALSLNSVAPGWSAITGSAGDPTCLTTQTVGGQQQVRFGDDDINPDCPDDSSIQSGFGFEGSSTVTFDSGVPFLLGELTHYNNPVFASSLLQTANLDLTIDFADPAYNSTFSTTVTLDETANNLNNCPYGDSQPCADRISIERQNFLFNQEGTDYQFEIVGLIPGTMAGCVYDEAAISTHFISDENAANSACLFGSLTALGDVELVISKEADLTEAQAGDTIEYRIDYNCFSTTEDCTGAVITDFLPDEVVYVGSTGSTHTQQPTGIYSESNHSVRFEFEDPLDAGSTGFVRVRVRVRDDGTVADGQLIENNAVSTLTNGSTNTALHTLPAVAFSNWEVVKTAPQHIYLDTDAPVTDTTYTVGICSAGSTVDLLNAQMVDTLPVDAVFVSASGTYVHDDQSTPQTITWTLGDLDASSGCTNRTVTLRFPEPTFTETQQVTNTVEASGDPVGEPAWTDSDSVTLPLERLTPDPRATLNKVSDRSGYVIGAVALFRLSPANTGNVPLHNFTVTDILPPQLDLTRVSVGQYSNFGGGQVTVRYQTSDNPGTWLDWPGSPFSANQTLDVSSLGLADGVYVAGVQWDYGLVQPGFQASSPILVYARILSPDRLGQEVTEGMEITNEAELYWDYPAGNDGEGISGTEYGSATLTVEVMPTPQFNKASAGGVSSAWRFLIGQQVGYYTLNINNNSGIALDNFVVTDAIPPQFEVTSITTGQYSSFGSGQVAIRYQTNSSGTWVDWPGSPFSNSSQTLNVSSLGLPSGVYITDIMWDYNTIPADFRSTTAPRINGRVLSTDRNGNPVNENDVMNNTAQANWRFVDIPNTLDDNSSDTVRQPIAYPSPQKQDMTGGPYIPSSIVTYRLRVMAANNSPSALINPIVADLLPEHLIYVPGSWSFNAGSTGAPAPVFEMIEDYNGTGRTLLRWSFTGASAHDFARGQAAYITFNAAIGPGATIGTLTNEYYLMTNDLPISPTTGDIHDLDGDGDTSDGVTGASVGVTVDELVGLDSVKGVRGELDAGFSVYPDTGRTIPNGDVVYRLSIINEGNIPIQDVRVIDILPFVGDTGVQDLRPRGSEWGPLLTGLVSAPANVTVYYSTSGNPCRPEVVSSGPAGCTAPNWSTLPPADITSVRSLRFDFAGILEPSETFNFTWTMQAPATAVQDTIAWNSFAFTSTNAQTGYPLRPSEPNKVGIAIDIPHYAPLIQLEKSTNGQDADFPTGPLVPINDPVTWVYTITNTGNTRLASITLTDDQLGPITCDEGAIPDLEAGASFVCTVSGGIAVAGQYTNLGTVTGTPVDDQGDPLIDPDTGEILPDVDDTDPSHYYGYDPNLALLGDTVWIDENGDGVQNAGEPGLPGITVRLLDMDNGGSLYATTTTDGDGRYYFVDLPVDSESGQSHYAVEFVLPGVYSFTTQDAGADDAQDSDADPVTGRTATITLTAGQHDLTWDAGVVAPASIGDLVWLDSNDNGIQDDDEPGMSGVTVRLLDENDDVIATTITDQDGIYRFIELTPGSYAIEVVAPAGYTFSLPDLGGDNALDSDVDRSTGRSPHTLLTPSENDPTWDAGLVPLASIGNYVWADMNNNGIQNGGEPGVPDVTVTLYASDGTQVATTTTGSTGNYSFTNLIPGDYYLIFDLPAGYIFSPQDEGDNESVDSDADPATGQTAVTTLAPDEDDPTWDAGLVPLASIGDYVWLDADNDGAQDDDESGFEDITVHLLDGAGTVLRTTTTDEDGKYLFADLEPGQYAIEVVPPADHVFSPRNEATDNRDSDVDRATGRTITTTLSPGENDLTWDAGLVPDSSVGNYVWYDLNNNGVQDDGAASRASGVTVNLLSSSGSVMETTTTDANGYYLFDHLTPGIYMLEFIDPAGYAPARQNQGGDDEQDSDPDRFSGRTPTFTLGIDQDDLTWDMGLVESASLGDLVWRDNDGSSLQDGGESGVPGVVVNLLDADGNPIDSTTTDGDGNYLFDDLPPDTYIIHVERPSGYVFSLQNEPSDDTDDSDVDINNGRSGQITLGPGEDDMTWDAGLIPAASIGNRAWRDTNNNGVQDTGETTGISGITVRLYNSSGSQVATTTTNSSGIYSFTGLRPGDYSVGFAARAGFIRSPQNATDNSLDSDTDASGRTELTTLDPGEEDLTWDAGYVPLASIGDRVWRDMNNNGIRDSGEPDLSGVTVTLYQWNGSTGTYVADTTTNGSGLYTFTNLSQGDYYLVFGPVDGYTRSPQNAPGSNSGNNSDADASGQTAITTLVWGENDMTWDAGYVPLASVGDYVWYDANDDGLQNDGTPDFSGVNITVTLYEENGDYVDDTVVADDGSYLFEDLIPGRYYLVFDLPDGYAFSRQDINSNANDTTDSDANRDPEHEIGRTPAFILAPGQHDSTWDAGIMRVASVGDFVWYDTNDNGLQDDGAPNVSGVSGVTVTLYDDAGNEIDDTVTDANGGYLFQDLTPGSYYLVFTPPADHVFSRQDVNSNANDATDSDPARDSGQTATFTLAPDQHDDTWDAGIMRVASVGDYVWYDTNDNGLQDDGDPEDSGVSGVTVTLYDENGDTFTTTTGADGSYSFTNLTPGSYYLVFDLPDGHVFSRQSDDDDPTIDSDPARGSGQTATFTLAPDQHDDTWDAGIMQLASIGNYVWRDMNNNGIQDDGAPGVSGVSGVTVTLYDENGVDTTTTTGADGSYSFTNLIPGDYYLVFTLPDHYMFSEIDAGVDDSLDSDAAPTTGQTATTTLLPGENDLTWDAGLVPLASVGDFVWYDANDNGLQDDGAPGVSGVSGVTVTLYAEDGTEIDDTITDGNGEYLFADLVPGSYYLVFTLQNGHVFSRQDVNSNTSDAIDSDPARDTGRTATFTLAPDQHDDTWDAGVMQVASVGDFVWYDANDNGLQDDGTPDFSGVNITVTLYEEDGDYVDDTVVTDDGEYLFAGLTPGSYYLVFTPPADHVFSRQDINSNANDTTDSDADLGSGQTITFTLAPGQHDDTWDAGIMRVASVGDFVWLDLNANGVQDASESGTGIEDVTVTLYDENGDTTTTTTAASGSYSFTDLRPGNYYLVFTLPDHYLFSPLGAGTANDSDADPTTGQTSIINLLPGEHDPTWDAGLYQYASLGDTVWEDLNHNGVQDTGEPGVSGISVTLYHTNGDEVATTVTDADGSYEFTDLIPGDYYVVFGLRDDYLFTVQGGGTPATNSDADPATGQTSTITLTSGQDDTDWDAGLYRTTRLGDLVWEDLNANGVQDAGEPGIPDVVVNLYDDTNTLIDSTITDGDGNYLFTGLVPDSYTVEFVLPPTYLFSPQDAGSDEAADSDADLTTGRTAAITLISNQSDLTWDAGLYRLASLGDFVWIDENANGLQDADEDPMPDIVVTLFDSTGARIAETITDANGLYLFENLVPGVYTVAFELPEGYAFTEQQAGGSTLDSDADTDTGRTPSITLISNQVDLTWDAGLLVLGALGDKVWEDLNYNGLQDAGEPGVPGVTVTLYGADGSVITTTTTDSSGEYLFIHLRSGEYRVGFTLPDGYGFSPQNAGSDDAADSDANIDTGQTDIIPLGWGQTNLTWDAGIVRLGSLGDRVWLDRNRNGAQDAGEAGIEGVTLRLDLPDGTQQTTVTGDDGLYLFDALPPGSYTVTVEISTLPSGLEATYDLDGTLDSITTVALSAGEHIDVVDFGYAPPAPVGATPAMCQAACVDWVLYHTNQTGDWEIFRLGPSGEADSINLSQGEGADDMAPTRSSNAEWIVFSSNRDGNWELYLAPANGDSSQIQRLTYNTIAIDTDPVWGPNQYVVFETTRNGNWDLYLLDMTSGATRQLTDDPASDINAFWSPDGSKLLFQSNRSGQWQLYELVLETGEITRLSDGQGTDLDAQYSSSGDQIAFRSYRDGQNSVLYLMNADGSGVRAISDPNGNASEHSWSPDDTLIAYQSNLDGDLDIYVYDVRSGVTRKLTDNDIADYAPTWQCATTRLLFTSDITGNPDIFDADALPIEAPAIAVDDEADQRTFDLHDDIYPEGAPTEENASREGRLPDVAEGLGGQTDFLRPDVSLTEPDLSLETGQFAGNISACPAPQESSLSADLDIAHNLAQNLSLHDTDAG